MLGTDARQTGRWSGTGWWLFLSLMAVYLASFSGSFHAIDEVSVAAMTESLVKHGDVTTDQIAWSLAWTPSQGRLGPDGHLYSKKGVGSALLGAPLYWLALKLPNVGAVQGLMLANSLVTALTGLLVYAVVLRLGFRRIVAVLTALAFGLGTMAWPYAKYFFSEPLTALGLMLALWGTLTVRAVGRPSAAALASIGLGVALLAKVANVVTWPLFLAYGIVALLERRQQRGDIAPLSLPAVILAFLVPLTLAIVGLAWYNHARTGQLLDLGYAADETFSTPLWYGLAGLLVSPGKSLFLYSPILLSALFGIRPLFRRDRATALLAGSLVFAYLLLYARWFMWWGGWSWGPRFLVPVLPFLSLFLAPVLEWALQPGHRWAVAVLGILGCASLAVQVLGVAIDFNRYYLLLYQRGLDSGVINFSARLSPLWGHLSLLRNGSLDLAWAQGEKAGQVGPRLAWPLAVAAASALGWMLQRWPTPAASEGSVGSRPSTGHWLLGLGTLGLLLLSMSQVARLQPAANDWQQGAQALTELMRDTAQPQDAMILDLLPYADHLGLTTSFMNRYKASPGYWGWARQEPVSAERQAFLASLAKTHHRLWLVLDTTPEADPASTTERWLEENAYRVEQRWLSPGMRLVRYELQTGSAGGGLEPLGFQVGASLRLEGVQAGSARDVHAGDVLPISLFWKAQRQLDHDYAVFLQLLDSQGALQAQIDRQPVGGFRPTTSWQPEEVVRDNYGLQLPDDLPPGEYRLIAGLYRQDSAERSSVSDAQGKLLGDYAPITLVRVTKDRHP